MLNSAEYLLRAEAADEAAAAVQDPLQRAEYVELAVRWRSLWAFTKRTEPTRPSML